MRLLRDDIGRLGRRPATWVMFAMAAGLMVFVFVVIGATLNSLPGVQSREAMRALLTFPAAYDAVLSFLTGLGGLLAVIYGAAVAGSEWTWGTLKNAVARGESRAGYSTALFGATAVVLALGLVLALAIGIAAAFVGASLAGISTAGLGDADHLRVLPERVVRAAIGVAESGGVGYAIATLARSQLAGIGVGIATYFGEQFSTILVPDVVKFLPFHVAEAVVNVTPPTGGFGGDLGPEAAARLAPDVALVAVAAWLVAAIVVSAVASQRAEIGG